MIKDSEKRKRVMERSMRLGHCICNAKKPCPCDVLKQHDVCPCAGEKLDAPVEPARLTALVEKAGCASKIDAASLRRVLVGLPVFHDPRVLVGAQAGDDAGVYRLNEDTALVQTVDVFSPSTDDPYTFGQIAAANSLSDVYAMGGRPLTALSIVGFPIEKYSESAMHEILRGGIDKMAEAGVPVIGGHSINDAEIKAGFAVTGIVHPDKIFANDGVRLGDSLILTKPLGTGIICFAAQIGRAPIAAIEAAAASMAMLNRRASELMIDYGASACTDVTGFGLMGHLNAMAAASRVNVEIIWDSLPLLPGVADCLSQGIVSGAVERNRESCGDRLTADREIEPPMLDLCFDPQTSGGLLIAVAPSAADSLVAKLHASGMTNAAVIGHAREVGDGKVFLKSNGSSFIRPIEHAPRRPGSNFSPSLVKENAPVKCCDAGHNPDHSVGDAKGATLASRKFKEFLQAANAPGSLDAKTKQAIALALSVMAKCEPCVKAHVKKARQIGFTQEEIDEAAWMAVAFGGSPTMMFYNGLGNAD